MICAVPFEQDPPALNINLLEHAGHQPPLTRGDVPGGQVIWHDAIRGDDRTGSIVPIVNQLELMHVSRHRITAGLYRGHNAIVAIENESLTDGVSVLLVDLRQAEMRLTLVLAHFEVVSIGGTNNAESVPNEVAELVVDVRSGPGVLIWCEEDEALREPILDGDVQSRRIGLRSLITSLVSVLF